MVASPEIVYSPVSAHVVAVEVVLVALGSVVTVVVVVAVAVRVVAGQQPIN